MSGGATETSGHRGTERRVGRRRSRPWRACCVSPEASLHAFSCVNQGQAEQTRLRKAALHHTLGMDLWDGQSPAIGGCEQEAKRRAEAPPHQIACLSREASGRRGGG